MIKRLFRIYEYFEYLIIIVSMIGMLLATFGMLFFYNDIKTENSELRVKQEVDLKQCKDKTLKCEVSQ